jgi:hypothetical protein
VGVVSFGCSAVGILAGCVACAGIVYLIGGIPFGLWVALWPMAVLPGRLGGVHGRQGVVSIGWYVGVEPTGVGRLVWGTRLVRASLVFSNVSVRG